MDLTPDILRTFVAAAQTLNFTQAAQRVNLTQSAVSIQVRKLEENLGKPLFNRVPRGVELTDHGENLLTYANRILELNSEAVALFKKPDLNGSIRIGAAEDYAALHLPGILRRFAEKYPLVEVDLFCDLSNDLLKMLEQGKIDICLRNAKTPESGGVFLRQEPVIWVGPKDAEPERKSPLPLAVFHQGCIYREWAIQALERQNIPYRIAYSSPSISGILAAVKTGLAVAPVGASTSMPGLRRISPEKLPELPFATVSLHQSECPDDSAQAHLVSYIMDEFCSLPLAPARLRSAG